MAKTEQITLWAFGQSEVEKLGKFVGVTQKLHEDGTIKAVSVSLMKRKDVAAAHGLNPKKHSAKVDEIMLGLRDQVKSAAVREMSGLASIAEWTAPENGALRKTRSKKGQESISLRLVKVDRTKGVSLDAAVAALQAAGLDKDQILELLAKAPLTPPSGQQKSDIQIESEVESVDHEIGVSQTE